MILCRIFTGFSDLNSRDLPFGHQGDQQTLYVIDELAIKGFGKHAKLLGLGEKSTDAVASEFRAIEGYSAAEFIDKLVKPIIIQEHFGVRTKFSFDTEVVDNQVQLTEDGRVALRQFANDWVVAVNVPETARSIPDGCTGVLVPKPYEGAPPRSTQISEGINGLSIDAESA